MILLDIVFVLLAFLLMYLLFIGVCCLLINPEKEYEKNSPFYRFLLDSATVAAMKLLRIQVHVSGIEKIPKDTKVLFVSNHRSNFDPIVTWYALKNGRSPLFPSPATSRSRSLGGSSASAALCPLTGKIQETRSSP